jgi:hypothetical protein
MVIQQVSVFHIVLFKPENFTKFHSFRSHEMCISLFSVCNTNNNGKILGVYRCGTNNKPKSVIFLFHMYTYIQLFGRRFTNFPFLK